MTPINSIESILEQITLDKTVLSCNVSSVLIKHSPTPHKLKAVFITMLLSVNAVFGGIDSIILCVNGLSHIHLGVLAHETHHEDKCSHQHEPESEKTHSDDIASCEKDCTDIELEGLDLDFTINKLIELSDISPNSDLFVLTKTLAIFPKADLKYISNLQRGPPENSASLVKYTVLRI